MKNNNNEKTKNYKDVIQNVFSRQLEDKFEKDNVPFFIRRFFVNLSSAESALTYWYSIRDTLLYMIEQNVIEKNNIGEITPEDMAKIYAEDITVYLRTREKEGIAPTTLNVRKMILKSFWVYMVQRKEIPVEHNIINRVRYKGISNNSINIVKKLPTEDEIRAMRDKIKKQGDKFIRERNFAILDLLLGSGIRESELAGLDIRDLHLSEDAPYIMVLGKGKYREQEKRRVYITGNAASAIWRWLVVRDEYLYTYNFKDKLSQDTSVFKNINRDALFFNKKGRRLAEHNIRAIFKNYSNGLTPHMIRHYYATIMNEKFGVAFVTQQVGHSNSNVTLNNYSNGVISHVDELMAL